jgi:hypothetical protein
MKMNQARPDQTQGIINLQARNPKPTKPQLSDPEIPPPNANYRRTERELYVREKEHGCEDPQNAPMK